MAHGNKSLDTDDRWGDALTSLAATGFAVIDGFLRADDVAALATEARSAFAQGLGELARIGQGPARQQRMDVRGDEIVWLHVPASPAQAAYFAAVDSLRLACNRTHLLNLQSFECHFAHYGPGRTYARHRDVFVQDDRRVLSLSLYLNKDWSTSHGGALRLYTAAGPIDVLPRSGTLALFLAREIEHEVLPATRDRYSLTGWLRQR